MQEHVTAPSIGLRSIVFAILILAAVGAAAAEAPADTTVHRVEDVVVSASRYGEDVHLSHSNLTREELAERIGVVDIPMLLTDTPGLHAYSDAGNGIGYTYLNIRGFDQKRVGVMINGIPLNDPEDHSVYWVDLPDFASSVEDVQVQRGITNSMGATTAIGGTVNLITDMLSRERGGRVSMMAGDYGTWRTSATYETGLIEDRYQSTVRYSRIESDGYRDRTGSDLWSAFWSGRALLGDHILQANVYLGHELTQQGWYAASEADLAVNRRHNPLTYENAVDDFLQPHYELHHTWLLSENVTLKNSAFWIHGQGFWENRKEGADIEDFSLDATLGLDPSAYEDGLDLVRRKNVDKDQVGLVSHLEVNHGPGRTVIGGDAYTFHSDHWGNVISVPDVVLEEDGVDYYGYQGDKQAWSIYVNEMVEVLPGLTLLGDLQYQHKHMRFKHDEVGNFTGADRHAYEVDYGFFNPKGGVHWQLPSEVFGGATAVYGHVGVTHREPTDSELYDTWSDASDVGVAPLFREGVPTDEDGDGVADYIEWSDPYVREERAVDYELGVTWRTAGVAMTLNGYWMDFDDEIVSYGGVDDNGLPIRGNAERTLHRGLELGMQARLTDAHVIKLAASRSWDEFDDFLYHDIDWGTMEVVTQDLSGNPIALFPEHLLSAALESDFGPLSTRLRVRSVGKQYLDNSGDDARTIDAYVTLDFAAALDLGAVAGRDLAGARLDLRVNNLTDELYETTGYWYDGRWLIPGAERNVLAGLHLDF